MTKSEHPVAHHVINSVGLSASIVLYGAGSLSSRYSCLAAICGIETIVGEENVCVEMSSGYNQTAPLIILWRSIPVVRNTIHDKEGEKPRRNRSASCEIQGCGLWEHRKWDERGS
ncbi:hypothetical protein TWF192_011083 [Orbilia oligospora]|nr:hypothetical protein TWF192_011083 [Orbilia oligospora]